MVKKIGEFLAFASPRNLANFTQKAIAKTLEGFKKGGTGGGGGGGKRRGGGGGGRRRRGGGGGLKVEDPTNVDLLVETPGKVGKSGQERERWE